MKSSFVTFLDLPSTSEFRPFLCLSLKTELADRDTTTMKDDDDYLNHHGRRHNNHPLRRMSYYPGKLCTRSTGYIILLILSYALGYFSAPSSNSNPTTPTVHTTPPTAITEFTTASNTTTTTTATDHNRFGIICADPIPHELIRQTILHRVFNSTSPFDNFPPPYIVPYLQPKRIKGWGSYGSVFQKLIRKVRPNTIIEVGSFLGASATHMARLTRELGLQTQILCLDDFRGWPGFRDKFKDIKMISGDVLLLQQFLQNVVSMNATDLILPLPFSTSSGLITLCEWGVTADLIEIDAGHDFHSAWADINRAFKLLRPGGVIFGHDYFTVADDRGVRRAVNLFAKVNGLKVKADGEHWVIDKFTN